jgi:hypothetical protein
VAQSCCITSGAVSFEERDEVSAHHAHRTADADGREATILD